MREKRRPGKGLGIWPVRLSATIAASFLAACLVPAAAPATSLPLKVEGVQFAAEYRTPDRRLALNNAALLRYRIFIKAYVAALYLGEGVSPDNVLDDVPKRLEIEYFWKISAEDFGRAAIEGIGRNVGPDAFAGLRERIERMNALYTDVRPGDRYALTYVPGKGTELALNGKPKGVIEGADFAAAIFSIWLGPRPLDEPLKTALLSRR